MSRNLLTEEERATLAEQWESESVQPIFDPPRYIAEMRAEIERLREELGSFQRRFVAVDEVLKAKNREDEIERLREELRLCIHVDKHIHITSGLRIEIERLQEALSEVVSDPVEKRQQTEIESLRIALGLLTTIKPDMEIDITDPVGMAQQIAAHVADEIERLKYNMAYEQAGSETLQAEIERLREENSTFSDSLAAKADRIDRLGEIVARQVAEIERLRDLAFRAHNNVGQLERYGGVYSDAVEDVLEAVADINDDLWHARSSECIRESVQKATDALQVLLLPEDAT